MHEATRLYQDGALLVFSSTEFWQHFYINRGNLSDNETSLRAFQRC